MIEFFLFQSALAEFSRLRRVLVWLFVAAGVFGAAAIWFQLVGTMKPGDAYARMSLILVYRVLPLVAAIFSTAIISQEVAQKTIVYLVTRPVRRSSLIVARMAAAVVVVFAISLLCGFAVSLATFGIRGAFAPAFLNDAGALAIGAAAYVALFTLFSLWVNRAMLVCLLFAFGWETFVPNMPGDLYHLSIYSYLTAFASKPSASGDLPLMNALAGQLGVNTISARTAAPTLLIVIAVCSVAAAWWFGKFEYVPREDAD